MLCVGFYARVSSEQQSKTDTLSSQIAALENRIGADGFSVPDDFRFVDDGYSGATLIRPGLERMRDMIAAGLLNRLYVHSPDRLARKYAYQVLLVEELQRCGVEIVFLNNALSQNPEESLLLQMQGMIAEYERAKIMERSRRGKRHGASRGLVNVLSGAPYGYRYIGKHEGGGCASYQIEPHHATVVRQVFHWVGRERVSIGEVARRLQQQGIASPRGKTYWDRTTVWGLLKNPAYKGAAVFGKTQCGARRPRLRVPRNSAEQPRKTYSTYETPRTDWIEIPVPALIDEALFDSVQAQLEENRKRNRQGARGAKYLLQGLVVCGLCGYAYYGKPVSPSSRKRKKKRYVYYRCVGTDAYRFGGQRVCDNKQVRDEFLEEAVWQQVQALLGKPERIEAEYIRRYDQIDNQMQSDEEKRMARQINQVKKGIDRLIDGYSEGLIEKHEFEPKIKQLRERLGHLEAQHEALARLVSTREELRLIIGRLEDFAAKVHNGLEEADWHTRRELIRTLVKRIEIGKEEVNVVFRAEPGGTPAATPSSSSHDCGRRGLADPVKSLLTLCGRPVESRVARQAGDRGHDHRAVCR